ncbi:MAG: acyltransferase [Bacillota bacterium]|nr:acyltransferase [Bacillota bacterium]
MQKIRIFYLDFIRAISIIAIVVSHFNSSILSHSIIGHEILIETYKNGDLGTMGVSLFFIISGSALMYTYNTDFSIKKFFKKRFLGIFPMFWIAYASAFLYMFYFNKTINHSIPKVNFILTILGMDGYFLYKIPNFYILGEWFLGCIIFLYFCFPLLRKLVIERPKTTFACIIVFYIIFVKKYNFEMPIVRNFLVRIPEFLAGMYFVQYIKNVKFYQFIAALGVCTIMFLFSIKTDLIFRITITGIALFFVLTYIAQYVKNKNMQNLFYVISRYSFAVFLVHHVVIGQVVERFRGVTISLPETYCLFVFTCTIITILSVYLFKMSNKFNRFLGGLLNTNRHVYQNGEASISE